MVAHRRRALRLAVALNGAKKVWKGLERFGKVWKDSKDSKDSKESKESKGFKELLQRWREGSIDAQTSD